MQKACREGSYSTPGGSSRCGKGSKRTALRKRVCALCAAFVLLLSGTALGASYKTLRRGDVSDEVTAMKTALAAVGYSLEINNVFDPTTEALIRAFQRTRGMTVDGVAGSETLERLYAEAAQASGSAASSSQASASSSASSSLRYGSTGSEVTALQTALRTLGYTLTADGKYGSATVAAVKAFQSAEGLTADGVAGQETLTRLYTRASQAASVTAAPTAAPTQAPASAALTARVTTSGGSLNLRQSASGTARVIASIPNGTYLTVLNYGSTWSGVVYSGIQGYVMTRFITLTGSQATVVPSVTATPSPYIYITPTPTPASQSGSAVPAGYAYVVTGGGSLNLRSAAVENSQVVITVPNGALVRVLASSASWSQIYYRGYTGYVMTGYLSASSSGTVTQAPTQTPQVTQAASYLSAQVTTSGGSLNLRESASTSGRVLTGIPNGASLSVTNYASDWCAVTYGAYRGYVMTRYLRITSGQTAAPVTAAPTSVPSDTGITARVTTSGGSLNLRQQPSPGSQILTSIPNSTVLSVSAYASIWCRVTYGSYDGYVMTKYLTILSGATATPAATATAAPTAAPASQGGLYAQVTGGSLNLRSAATTGSQVLTVLPSGAFLTVTSYGSLWSAVTYGSYSGYVMTQYIRLYSSGQTTAAPAATITPAAAQTASAYDTSIFTRTLRSGYTGTDVTLVQKRLAELNYLSSSALSGTYDSATMTAVKLFQKMHGLSQDGLAGAKTFALLFSSSAIAYSGDISDYTTLHIYYSTVDTSLTSSVQKMQRRLKELGYTCNVTGRFDETTYMAVLSFQLRNGVSVTGAADPATQLRLYSSSANGPTAAASLELEEGAGYISGPTVSEIQLLHWYNTVKPGLSGGNTLLVYDPTTHLSWNLRVMSCGRHADCEPLTLRDTLIMFRALGQPSWTVHPVYVKLPDGTWTMATMHDRPHLSGYLSDNGFDGHLCVHFLRDMDETRQYDPNYGVTNQTTLREAWKALTGETVN